MRDLNFFLRRYAPVTTHMAFFETSAAVLAEEIFVRAEGITKMWELPWQVKKQAIRGDLANKLNALLPLTSVRASKVLVSATNTNWSAYLPNGFRGGDVHGEPGFFAGKLKIRTLTVVLVADEPKGQPGSFQFVLYDGRSGDVKTRAIAAHKESRWEFSASGEQLPFEEVEAYKSKKIRDRLTVDMVERYCEHLGIDLFDPDFYEGEGYIIHSYPPPNTTFYPEYPNQKAE